MLPGSNKQYFDIQAIPREGILFEKIVNSEWWSRATNCVDSHYSNIDGVMLSDHLLAVTENIDKIFNCTPGPFLKKMFALLELMNIEQARLREELKIISLLHDIGKIDHDKSKQILHPIGKHFTVKRHSVVSLYAAIEILEDDSLLDAVEKKRIYATIEEHDVSYGLFREWLITGKEPKYERWKLLNDRIDTQPGAGLIYLLFFKLADTHGHCNITDVIWFYRHVKYHYFNRLGIDLPVPTESDIR